MSGNSDRPADPGQLRFFLLDGLDSRTPLLQHITVEGAVNHARLAAAVRAVCEMQPALRTSLHTTVDGLVQRVHPAAEVDIQVDDDEAALSGHVVAARAPFVHGAGPLCRVRIVATPGRTHCLVGVHHAVFDEDSSGVLLRQLAQAYQGVALPLAAARYAPDAERTATLRAFWSDRLDGCPEDTELPRIGPAGPLGPGVVTTSLPAELVTAMRARAREVGATPFAQVLAAVAVATGWYAQTEDVVLATVATNRTEREADVIGCLQNTLPIRLRLAGLDTESVLDHAVDSLFDAVDHADLPIEDILALVGVVRRPGCKPLTQVICTQATAAAPVTTGDLRWQLTVPVAEEAEYDLAVTLHDGALSVAHNRAALPEQAALRFADHLLRALTALTGASATPLAELRLHDEERPRPAVAPAFTPLPELIAKHARSAPAVRTGAEQLDYAELDRRVTTLAAALIEAGVQPRDRVAVCLPRTVSLVVALLAVWRAGAAYLPLDPEYPADRLRYMAEDAGLAAWVGLGEPAVAVPALTPEAVAGAEPEQWPAVHPDDPAYLIYTSGSTGRPKGVVIRHENLAALFASFDELLPSPPAVTVAGTSISFDISALELYWPLARGREVLLTSHRQASTEPVPDGALYQCTPTTARILTRDPAGRRLLGGLGGLLVGGETLPGDLAEELVALVPGPVLNCYGPTETTVWSTAWRVRPGTKVHIGRPLAGEDCRVVDANGRALPPGVPGRLMVFGAGVGDGYWQRPELTAERFALHDGELGYDTGDLAALDPEHGLLFLGRKDAQVKVLGQRIELTEIEAVLRTHPAVRDVVAAVTLDGTAITARVVPTDPALAGPAPAELAERLRQHAAQWLLPAMVPAHWLLADHLPQLPNGKLDRSAVPTAQQTRPVSPPAGTTATELVRRTWEHVLGVPVIEGDASFFQLGGTSAGVLRVLAVLRQHQPDLTVAELFQYTTVLALARRVGRAEPPEEHPVTGRGARRARALAGWRRP